MRKLLLGTTAVVGAALLSTGASAQTAPTVRIGGFFDFSYNFISDTADRGTQLNNARRPRSSDFRSDMEIHVLVSGKTAGGIGYGARIELQNDNFTSTVATGVDTDETWLFVTSPTLGTVRMGDTDAAAAVMQVRPPRIPAFYRSSWQVARPASTSALSYLYSGVTDGSDITKITYLSPQFAGFDFGVSYAINSGEGARQFSGAGAVIDRDRRNRQNEITAALRYRGNFSGVGVAAGFVTTLAESGPNQRNFAATLPQGRDRMSAYAVGATLGYQGFTFGGEFVWGNYRGGSVGVSPTANGADQSWHYLLGASYRFNPVTVTANFGQAYQDNVVPGAVIARDGRNTLIGVGATYTIAPGLLGYINYEYQRFRGWPGGAVGSIRQGDGRIIQGFTIGTTLSF